MVNLKFPIGEKNLHSATCCFQNLLYHNCNKTTYGFLSRGRNYSTERRDLTRYMDYSVAYPFLQSSGLQHRFKNWQHLRNHKLTASTFSSAIGFWPRRRIQLWLEKIGAIEPFSGNLATSWDNIKEKEAVERYQHITRNRISLPNFPVYDHKEDWIAASPDGLVDNLYSLPSSGVLEIKCPFFNGDRVNAVPWRRIPLQYIPQAQGLIEILDRDWMDMFVWTVNGCSLFRLHRDSGYWGVLKIALSDFWWKHVHPARELYTNSEISDPLCQLSSFRPAPRHDLCGCIVYKSKLIVDNSMLIRREINGQLQD